MILFQSSEKNAAADATRVVPAMASEVERSGLVFLLNMGLLYHESVHNMSRMVEECSPSTSSWILLCGRWLWAPGAMQFPRPPIPCGPGDEIVNPKRLDTGQKSPIICGRGTRRPFPQCPLPMIQTRNASSIQILTCA